MERMKLMEYIIKTREYLNYLERHVRNVEKAWELLANKCYDMKFVYDDYVYHEISNHIANHDLSKISIEEFMQYRQFFYPVDGEKKDKDLFKKAWEHHKINNEHHWENWTVKDSKKYYDDIVNCVHMVVDWIAMGFEMGDTAKQYYEANKDKIDLPDWAVEFIYNIFDRIY